MVQKKVVRPEVYDLMDKIIESMITSNSVTLQKSCKNVYIAYTFYLNWLGFLELFG